MLVVAGKMLHLSQYYYIGLNVAVMLALYHYFLINKREKTRCFKAFLHNNWFGFAVFTGLAAHYLVQYAT